MEQAQNQRMTAFRQRSDEVSRLLIGHRPHLPPDPHSSVSLRAQPCTHASGAHRERSGIALLQTPLAVARLRAVASRSRNLGSGNSSCYSLGSLRFPDSSAATLRQWLRAERERERRSKSWTEIRSRYLWWAALRCFSETYRVTADFSLLFLSYLEVRLSLSEVR